MCGFIKHSWTLYLNVGISISISPFPAYCRSWRITLNDHGLHEMYPLFSEGGVPFITDLAELIRSLCTISRINPYIPVAPFTNMV